MRDNFTAPITYFLAEGKTNLEECLKVAFRGAIQHSIKKIVIFSAQGHGVKLALEHFLKLDEYSQIQLIAVTFPVGKKFTTPDKKPLTVEISASDRKSFSEHGVPIIRAHLPFDTIRPRFQQEHGLLGQDAAMIGSALSIFGGSMSLCVQAILLACDAGYVGLGEHVISLTSDTAILARATCTTRLLSDFIVREVLCKPAILTIGRKELKPGDVLPETTESTRRVNDSKLLRAIPSQKKLPK